VREGVPWVRGQGGVNGAFHQHSSVGNGLFIRYVGRGRGCPRSRNMEKQMFVGKQRSAVAHFSRLGGVAKKGRFRGGEKKEKGRLDRSSAQRDSRAVGKVTKPIRGVGGTIHNQ